jgi:hypothetical protein
MQRTYILVGVVVCLDGVYPAQHGVVVVRLAQILGPVVSGEAEHVLLLGVVVRDVHDGGLDGDGPVLACTRALRQRGGQGERKVRNGNAKRVSLQSCTDISYSSKALLHSNCPAIFTCTRALRQVKVNVMPGWRSVLVQSSHTTISSLALDKNCLSSIYLHNLEFL